MFRPQRQKDPAQLLPAQLIDARVARQPEKPRFKLCRRLQSVDRGRILFGGRDVTGVPVQRRSIAMVYQQFINYPTMTVYENIASPMRVAGTDKAITLELAGEDVVNLSFADHGLPFVAESFVTTQDAIDNDREALKSFLEATDA